MPKPDYLGIALLLETETDPAIRASLLAQLYDFSPPSPLPPGESIEDYILTPEEEELFGYVDNGYVEPNPGTLITNQGDLFVSAGYVVEGYINIESSAVPPYVLEGYVDENYIVLPASIGDFVAYVGEYYNDLGETT